MRPLRVFISYATPDYRIAQALTDALRDDGFDVPLHLHDQIEVQDLALTGGDSERSIRRSLDEADAFVVLVSAAAYEVPNRFEWIEILRRIWSDETTVVLPVLLDDACVPGFLRDHTALRMSRIDSLAEDVARYLRDPLERGVCRPLAGRERLRRVQGEVERTAAALAEAADPE